MIVLHFTHCFAVLRIGRYTEANGVQLTCRSECCSRMDFLRLSCMSTWLKENSKKQWLNPFWPRTIDRQSCNCRPPKMQFNRSRTQPLIECLTVVFWIFSTYWFPFVVPTLELALMWQVSGECEWVNGQRVRWVQKDSSPPAVWDLPQGGRSKKAVSALNCAASLCHLEGKTSAQSSWQITPRPLHLDGLAQASWN